MSALREWIVTLHDKNDLESFYEDMETPGGSITIPERRVQCRERRNISRNTHYMLTYEEAMEIKKDPRVWDVDLREIVDLSIRPHGWSVTNGEFDKSWAADASDLNWGLLRSSEATNRNNWGANGTSLVTDDLTVTASGKNVDVVIVDGHIDPAHPEFAVNPDGSGGSRVVQFNWFSLTNAVSGGSNGTYVYDRSGSYTNSADVTDNNHGCHVAGTVAGNTQGWARDANIYNISPYSTNPNSLSTSLMWDYIREWHNTKSVNPETGRRNPTITNNSYGSSIISNAVSAQDGYDSGVPTRVTYRGVDYNPGRDLTQAELQARGFYCPSDPASGGKMTIPYYFTSRQADIQDAIDDGIIVVASAGNDSWKIVDNTDQDYNNNFQMVYAGVNYTWWLNRGTGSGAGYAPVIVVGAASSDREEDKAPFSQCGNQVDIYAPGEGIQSSLHSGGITDPRDVAYDLGKYQGTSMSGPQVAGVLACLAEQWQNIKQADAQTWLTQVAGEDQMLDTGTDNAMDLDSLQGAANLYLRWINQRATVGNTYPLKTLSYRPTSGAVYPRVISQITRESTTPVASYTYTVTPTQNNVDEGDSLTFSVSVPGWPNGTALYWRVGPGTSRDADFQFQSGNIIMTNGNGAFQVNAVADQLTESAETFNITLRTGSGSGPIVYTSPNYTINDTSTTPTFTPDYTITVTAAGSSAYTMVGTDRNGAVSGNNPTLAFNNGDKVRFTVNAGGHPLYIKTIQGTGSGNQVSGATGQGTDSGNIDWTIGSTGTFYYNCEFHGAMTNSITVS